MWISRFTDHMRVRFKIGHWHRLPVKDRTFLAACSIQQIPCYAYYTLYFNFAGWGRVKSLFDRKDSTSLYARGLNIIPKRRKSR